MTDEAFYDPFEDMDVTTWAAVDLAPYVRGDVKEVVPTMLARDDGLHLLYAAKVHALNSESEAGKTWLALYACAERMRQGEHVGFIDFEDEAGGVVGRLFSLGLPAELIHLAFHYIRPDEPMSPAARRDLMRMVDTYTPSLVVLDGVTEAMALHDMHIENNNDAARFMKQLVRPIARAGCATLLLDHLNKDRNAQGRYAIGAQHKLAGLDGAVYKMENITPFGRGLSGSSRLLVMKDRPGYVRPRCKDAKRVGTFQFTADTDGMVTAIGITPPGVVSEDSAAHTDDAFLEKLSRVVEKAKEQWVNTTAIRKGVEGGNLKVQFGLAALVTKKCLTRKQEGKAVLYKSVKPFRAEAEPDA